jgi:hypothetical protein
MVSGTPISLLRKRDVANDDLKETSGEIDVVAILTLAGMENSEIEAMLEAIKQQIEKLIVDSYNVANLDSEYTMTNFRERSVKVKQYNETFNGSTNLGLLGTTVVYVISWRCSRCRNDDDAFRFYPP